MNILEAIKYPVGTEFEVWGYSTEHHEGIVIIQEAESGHVGSKKMFWKGSNTPVGVSDYTTECVYKSAEIAVSFMEAVSNPRNRIRVDLSDLSFTESTTNRLNQFETIPNMLLLLEEHLNSKGISEAITDGKWYAKEVY